MKKAVLAAVVAAMALGGCAGPLVKPGAFVLQNKVGHASDWKHVARRAAEAFAATTRTTEKPKVFVAPGPADMPFAAAYRGYLERELLRLDYPVVDTAAGAVVINFEVQTYWYGSASGNQKQLIEYTSLLSTLGATGYEMRHMNSPETLIADGYIAGPLIDLLASFNATTRSEVIVNTSVVDEQRAHYLNSESFYVYPSDLPFYWTRLPSTSPTTLKASSLAVVPLPVVNGYR